MIVLSCSARYEFFDKQAPKEAYHDYDHSHL